MQLNIVARNLFSVYTKDRRKSEQKGKINSKA